MKFLSNYFFFFLAVFFATFLVAAFAVFFAFFAFLAMLPSVVPKLVQCKSTLDVHCIQSTPQLQI